MIAHQFFAGNGKGVTMANGLPLLEGLWEGGLAVCPSALEKWMNVVMAMGMEQVCRWPMASHLLQGMWEVGHGLCLTLP